jgi:hypothetical protein
MVSKCHHCRSLLNFCWTRFPFGFADLDPDWVKLLWGFDFFLFNVTTFGNVTGKKCFLLYTVNTRSGSAAIS